VFTRGRTEQVLQRFLTGASSPRALEELSIHPNHTVRMSAQDLGDLPSLALEPIAERLVMTAWENFVTGVPVAAAAVSKAVLSSWQRSRRAGVEPTTRFAPVVTGGDALEQLRRINHDLLWAAQGLFVTSAHLLERSGSIMLLTDPNGVVLEVAGDMRTLESAQDIHLVEGGHWHESVVGTNGIGTALAMRQPVQVHAAEHFGEGIKSWTCAAAPVFYPGTERVLGVIDISGPPSTYQRGNLLLALAAARQMEAVLADRANREHVQLLEASMKFGAVNTAEAVLVLDRNAKLIYASGSLPGVDCRPGCCLPGLEAGRSAQEWARHLPPALRGEWLHPVRVDGVTIGALLWVPKFVRNVALARAADAVSSNRPSAFVIDPMRDDFAKIQGHSPALRTAVERARMLGGRRVAVLIQGETGVGKELFARAVHGDDSRSGPYVTFNCGAASKELIASELFGHVRGAYTGATHEGRAGCFELAHGGTLCLDEIGELPLDLQPVLLRCLEEGVVSRLGESKQRRVDVRLLAMTNRDLLEEVEAGRFRRDLYHRISVTCVRVPPLREREADIELLVDHFNRSLAERHGIASRHFGPDVTAMLRAYDWPGNVRELRNVVESLLLTSNEREVACTELPEELRAGVDRNADMARTAGAASLEETERLAIVRAVNETHGNLAQAARALGVSRSTLYRKVERYHLESLARHDGGAAAG
jgi:sigma-54 dependent transcriptional regulator, acetoin dehydrogenase operon transcriptional activator AcoR